MKEIGIQEFVRRIKESMSDQDCRFAFFLGSGCSVSSGVPAAGALVKNWLPRLKKVKTGDDSNLSEWTKKEFPGYNGHNAAQFYGKVIEKLFFTPEERQKEIERLTEGKDPGFGYAVLAHMMSHENCGRHCNIVLTTNFDDMVADALYLYTNKKPLVISHESLVNFVRISRTRPLAIKLHGDARLAPLNTEMETEKLGDAVKKVLNKLLSETGLIFIGYGGNDNSIADILNELPKNALPWGIYWINADIPNNKIGEWLRCNNAIWVKHTDFDEAMLLFWKEFNLGEPDWKRFDELSNAYYETFKSLSGKIDAKPETEEKGVLEEAIQKVISESSSWWSIELEASKYKKTDQEKADLIYSEGLKKFHDNVKLIGNYASFLNDIRKDYEKAEELYKRALGLDPNNTINNCNYATFLYLARKDYDKAEELYKRVLELDPSNADMIGSYANFLKNIRKDYDKAEELYKRALELDSNNARNMGSYSTFLKEIRKDYNRAEELCARALELDPNNATNIGNYANVLFEIHKDYLKAEELYKRALELDPNHAINTGNYATFNYLIRKDHVKAETLYKKALEQNPHHAKNMGNYASFLFLTRKDHVKAEELYKRALELDPTDVDNTSNYARFLNDIRKDYDKSEELYKRALELDPTDAYNTSNYATFLYLTRKDHAKAEELYKRALELDPKNADNFGSYANFVKIVRKDYDKAEELYKRALELEPNHANCTGNYAGLLLSRGKEEGFELLEKALNLAVDETDLILECRFYEYAHIEDSIEREKNLTEIKKLINSGVRSLGWNLEENVNRAIQDAHPQPDLLKVLAKVVADELDVKELDKFTVWKK